MEMRAKDALTDRTSAEHLSLVEFAIKRHLVERV